MHPCLNVDEIVRLLAHGLVDSEEWSTAVALACCCKNFEDPVLDALWGIQEEFYPLLDTFPDDVWNGTSQDLTFKRMPTTAEWGRFATYARRMRELRMDLSEESLPLKVLSELQLRYLNKPLLPNLKLLEIRDPKKADIIPFIPLFLSPRTTDICIQFKWVPSVEKIAPVMVDLPKLCPHVQNIILEPLPRDSTIIRRAASDIFLAWNSDSLRVFRVCSPLTEEARRIILQLPNLRELGLVFKEPIALPDISLPDLTRLDIEFYHDHGWLQAFHGTTLSKLTCVDFQAEGFQEVGNFLEVFRDLAVATSASAVLSHFRFYTYSSWNPNYHSLLGFKQLEELVLAFSCLDICSPMDDETLITLAQAMPTLEILQIGHFSLCDVPGGVTIRGLIALARYCPGLSSLCIHFQAESLVSGPIIEGGQSFRDARIPWEDCALTTLDVGDIPLPEERKYTIALALLRIFPHLQTIHYLEPTWEWAADYIFQAS